MYIQRRQFLARAGAALAAGPLLSRLEANPMNQPIGFQGFEILPDLTKDWDGTWQKMAGFGYKFVDLVRSPPVSTRSAKDIRRSLDHAGLGCVNCHLPIALTDSFGEAVAYAHDLGLTHVTGSPNRNTKTIDDWKRFGDQMNALGVNVRREGLQLAYHNHEIEFRVTDGQIPYDVLMGSTDPALVKFQIDVGNLTFAGKDATTYLKKYPDRYFSMHCKDFAPGQAAVPVGTGILDWKQLFALAKKAGIKNYVTEVGAYNAASLDVPLKPSPLSILELFRLSYEFVHQFQDA